MPIVQGNFFNMGGPHYKAPHYQSCLNRTFQFVYLVAQNRGVRYIALSKPVLAVNWENQKNLLSKLYHRNNYTP